MCKVYKKYKSQVKFVVLLVCDVPNSLDFFLLAPCLLKHILFLTTVLICRIFFLSKNLFIDMIGTLSLIKNNFLYHLLSSHLILHLLRNSL